MQNTVDEVNEVFLKQTKKKALLGGINKLLICKFLEKLVTLWF